MAKEPNGWGRAISDVFHEIVGESKEDHDDRHQEREERDRDADNRKSDSVSDRD